jgi:CCR4-NOT transcription complex subunit 1
MEVFSKYFRRLLQTNAGQIFPSVGRSGEANGSYQMLVTEMQKLHKEPEQATKIAESLDSTEGDLFRDFDLSTFMAHFQLDVSAKAMLSLACRLTGSRDLRSKGIYLSPLLVLQLLTLHSRCDYEQHLERLDDEHCAPCPAR